MGLEQTRMTSKQQHLEQVIQNLKIGDIILVRSRQGVISRLIRFASASYWTHVALVFDVPQYLNEGVGLDEVLIAETDVGVQMSVHRLQSYLLQSDRYELGIKRMPGLSDEERERFRGLFLGALDTPYDVLRVFIFFIKTLVAWITGINVSFKAAQQLIKTRQLVCTTFAQRSYYLAVAPHKRRRVIFRGHENKLGFLEQMESITPGDIARSRNTIWLHNPHS